MKSKRVILDTNLWISFLISKRQLELDQLFRSGEVTILFSQELVDEFLSVANRPKFKKFFDPSDIEELLGRIAEIGELVIVQSDSRQCRDQKDNFLLNLALDGKADFLVTGDSDLLILEKIENTQIIAWSDFVSKTQIQK